MKTRILFVDDEPLTLQGLQRMLRSARGEWDMAFADSGARALELLDESPFDIVVSDMLMPGMNGAQLLTLVSEHHPATARFVLSGHADRNLVLQSTPCAHQYLAKPCSAEHLKARLSCTARWITSLDNAPAIRHVVSKLDRFPAVPHLYNRLLEELSNGQASIESIQEIVSVDIGLSATLLKLVNSAFFGAGRPSSDLHGSVALIGLDTLRDLALTTNAFSPVEPELFSRCKLESLWNHSRAVAIAARAIAQVEGADEPTLNAAFVGGLLHDAGRFLLRLHFHSELVQAESQAKCEQTPFWKSERDHLGAAHQEVGAFLCGLWGLPPEVTEAVAWHHEPGRSGATVFGALTAVHAANALIREGSAGSEAGPVSGLDWDHLESIGLTERIPNWRQATSQES